MTAVAVVGARGYVGRAIVAALRERGDVDVTPVSRDEFAAASDRRYDVVVNAAMPSARFRARKDPLWDFDATVATTARLRYGWIYGKLVQVSSVSARCQTGSAYGRHKQLAELLCEHSDLVVRLGPMYSDDLAKGVLVDMLEGRSVWVAGSSRYGFAPRDWVAGWIAANLEQTGIVEVGARDAIPLGELAQRLGANVEFHGEPDHQEIFDPAPDFPAAADVVGFMLDQAAARA